MVYGIGRFGIVGAEVCIGTVPNCLFVMGVLGNSLY